MNLPLNLVALSTIVRKEMVRVLRIWIQTVVPPAITMTLYFIDVIATDEGAAGSAYDAIARDPEASITAARDYWNNEVRAAFTPGNDRFSGSLPVLETSNEAIRRLYFQGVLAALYHKRELPGARVDRKSVV